MNTINSFIDKGANKSLFALNEATTDDKLIFQGELHEGILTYNTQKCSMREAMIAPKTLKGLQSKMFLEYYLNSKSLTMLQDLVDKYTGHVIEFGVYEKSLGVLPNHNTVIWEVRNY